MCRGSRERLEQAHGEFYNQEVLFALCSEINEQPLELPDNGGDMTVSRDHRSYSEPDTSNCSLFSPTDLSYNSST